MSIRSIFIISQSCCFAGVWALDKGGGRVCRFPCLRSRRDLYAECVLNARPPGRFLYPVAPALFIPRLLRRAASLPGPGWGNPNSVKWGQRKTRRQTSGTMWLHPEPRKRQVGRVCWAEKRVTPRVTETHRQRRCRKRELQEERKQGRRGKGGKLVDGFHRTTLQLLCGSALMTPRGQHLL